MAERRMRITTQDNSLALDFMWVYVGASR